MSQIFADICADLRNLREKKTMEPLTIIKIGGNVIDNDTALPVFLERFAQIPGYKILVHGGGKLATRLAEILQVPQQMINGRRVTDAESLKIVTMVYAGDINKRVTALLQSYGCNAIGLSGADGNLVRAKKREVAGTDYGFVGDLQEDSINTGLLVALFKSGLVPVVAPITHDQRGQLFNTNADTIASALATSLAALAATTLIYCFEKRGVLRDPDDDHSVIGRITKNVYEDLKQQGIITAGMIPKIDNALLAIEKGVNKVIIGSADEIELLAQQRSGTIISNE